jgi:hypothetical protein
MSRPGSVGRFSLSSALGRGEGGRCAGTLGITYTYRYAALSFAQACRGRSESGWGGPGVRSGERGLCTPHPLASLANGRVRTGVVKHEWSKGRGQTGVVKGSNGSEHGAGQMVLSLPASPARTGPVVPLDPAVAVVDDGDDACGDAG